MSSSYNLNNTQTQNELLLNSLMIFYKNDVNINTIMQIIDGESKISLRIVDWFVTNYSKKYYTIYTLNKHGSHSRFKVYNDYKLKLKSYSKKRFDPFCRWDRISIPCSGNQYMETTIGQLNFFKWAIEHDIISFIESNYESIEIDMNNRNSITKTRNTPDDISTPGFTKTRKKREELSLSACKCIKKEIVKIIVNFDL